MGNIDNITVRNMQKRRVKELVKTLHKRYKVNLDDAYKMLMNTMTYQELMKPETDFYWKSMEELKYLLSKELENNFQAWKAQA